METGRDLAIPGLNAEVILIPPLASCLFLISFFEVK